MGAAAIPIAIALSAGATGYGIYAGERARSESAKQYREARAEAKAQREQEQAQMAQDKIDMTALDEKSRAEQESTNSRLRGEQDAALAKVRGEVPGMQERMGEDLLAQQEHAYKRMSPLIENRLSALGLLQSGALPEAQAKAQGDLESNRQAALADFRRNAENTLNIQQPLANSSSDVARQSAALGYNLNTSRENLSQMFANQNNFNLNEAARNQYLGNLQSANNAAAQSSANAYMQFGGQLAGGAMQLYGIDNQNKRLKALERMRGG